MAKDNTIVIHNQKNANHRTVHADGALVSLTPNGYVNINFYSQRAAIPKGTVFEITKDGHLGEITGNIDGSKDGIIREMDFGIYMDIETCESLKKLLEDKLKEFKGFMQEGNKTK